MKNLFLSLIAFFFLGKLCAQVTPEVKSNWETLSENNEVKISKRTVFANDVKNGTYIEYEQLQYQNKTPKQVVLNFYVDATYTNKKGKSNLDDEDYRAILLDPNQTFTPNFTKQKDKMHFIFKRLTNYPNKPTLTNLKLVKVKTTTL